MTDPGGEAGLVEREGEFGGDGGGGPPGASPLLELRSLETTYTTDRGDLKVLDGVSLALDAGRILGLVGESGSGKTALLRSVMGLFPTSHVRMSGHVLLDGQDLLGLDRQALRRLWGSRIAMVFQDPMSSLNPVMRVGRQVSEGPRTSRHLGRSEARELALATLRSAGIRDASEIYGRFPHQLSGGLRQRVAIAIAIASAPQLLLADEPTTSLDVTIQAQILYLLGTLARQRRIAVVLVTHDLAVAASTSDTIAVMYAGRIVEMGPAATVMAVPRMRYTQALIRTSPQAHHEPGARLEVIPGRPADPIDLAPGCAFAPRCGYADERCLTIRPELEITQSDTTHRFACWNPSDSRMVAPEGPALRQRDDDERPAT